MGGHSTIYRREFTSTKIKQEKKKKNPLPSLSICRNWCNTFYRAPMFIGSLKNLSIWRALVLMDISKTFSSNSTTSPPSIVGSIWHIHEKELFLLQLWNKTSTWKILRNHGSYSTYLLFELNLLPLSNYILKCFFQFFLLFSRKGLVEK